MGVGRFAGVGEFVGAAWADKAGANLVRYGDEIEAANGDARGDDDSGIGSAWGRPGEIAVDGGEGDDGDRVASAGGRVAGLCGGDE